MTNEPNKEVIAYALNMWANWIETGDPVLSAVDAEKQKAHRKALNTDQMELVVRLRKLAKAQLDPRSGMPSIDEFIQRLRQPIPYRDAIRKITLEGAAGRRSDLPGNVRTLACQSLAVLLKQAEELGIYEN